MKFNSGQTNENNDKCNCSKVFMNIARSSRKITHFESQIRRQVNDSWKSSTNVEQTSSRKRNKIVNAIRKTDEPVLLPVSFVIKSHFYSFRLVFSPSNDLVMVFLCWIYLFSCLFSIDIDWKINKLNTWKCSSSLLPINYTFNSLYLISGGSSPLP